MKGKDHCTYFCGGREQNGNTQKRSISFHGDDISGLDGGPALFTTQFMPSHWKALQTTSFPKESYPGASVVPWARRREQGNNTAAGDPSGLRAACCVRDRASIVGGAGQPPWPEFTGSLVLSVHSRWAAYNTVIPTESSLGKCPKHLPMMNFNVLNPGISQMVPYRLRDSLSSTPERQRGWRYTHPEKSKGRRKHPTRTRSWKPPELSVVEGQWLRFKIQKIFSGKCSFFK